MPEIFLKIILDSPEFNCSIIFLEVGFHDEEDGSISSTLDNRRANFPGSTLVQVLSPIGKVLVDELTESRFVVLLWPLIGLQNHPHSILTQSL